MVTIVPGWITTRDPEVNSSYPVTKDMCRSSVSSYCVLCLIGKFELHVPSWYVVVHFKATCMFCWFVGWFGLGFFVFELFNLFMLVYGFF